MRCITLGMNETDGHYQGQFSIDSWQRTDDAGNP